MTESQPHRLRTLLRIVLGVLSLVFGAATLFSGGQMLFGDDAVRAEAGNVVQFVLRFNFGAAFLYVSSGLAVLINQRVGLVLARVLAATTILVFIALGIHIMIGRPFEMRTVIAMTLRSVFWIVQVVMLSRLMESARITSVLV